jgi:2-(1,2-epoxy-1,2-dihydrophenyl)acetyl-CoA isomerase
VSDLVRFELVDGVGHVVLTQGDRGNPINLDLTAQLLDAVRAAERADVGVVVLRSEGKHFCFGGDVRAFGTAADPARYVDDVAEALHRAISELLRLDAVVVTRVAGAAAGAGFPLVAAGDVVVAADTATFTMAYTKIGLTPDGGSSTLVATLGLHRMLWLSLLNPVLTAAEAHAAGLVARVVPEAELDAALGAVIEILRSGSRSAQVQAKRLMRDAAQPAPETLMRKETLGIRSAAGTPDGREGVAAFLAKRDPEFNQG